MPIHSVLQRKADRGVSEASNFSNYYLQGRPCGWVTAQGAVVGEGGCHPNATRWQAWAAREEMSVGEPRAEAPGHTGRAWVELPDWQEVTGNRAGPCGGSGLARVPLSCRDG